MKLTRQNWTSPKLGIESVRINWREEQGVFALETIRRNESIVVYGGSVVTWDEFSSFTPGFQSYFYQIDDDLLFGPASLDCLSEGELINHSCNANAGFRSVIHLVAMRDISVGEQITVDYATLSTENVDHWECSCGEAVCRKRITGNDWKLPELQQRYGGYFQPYIEAMISRLVADIV